MDETRICEARFKSGEREGQRCGREEFIDGLCGFHWRLWDWGHVIDRVEARSAPDEA